MDSRGGGGDNFTNTTISSAATIPVNSAGASFGGIYTPDAHNGVGTPDSGNNINFSSLYSAPNGTWTFGVEDGGRGDVGSFDSWSITINYTVPNTPLQVIWSPAIDLYTDATLSTNYSGQAQSTVYAKPASAGNVNYTATTTDINSCSTSQTVALTVNPAPSVTINAIYCSDRAGYVKLTATSVPAATTYLWSTTETTQSIYVNVSDRYEVTAFAGTSCPGKAYINIAQELVQNGNFEQGNVGFTTDYTLSPTPLNNCSGGLYPAGTYDVKTNGQLTHCNFWGKDHTSRTGNFMLINGSGPSSKVWQQTVNVLPNTTYYLSAWAMALNSDNGTNGINNAKLRFSVNNGLLGTTATLTNHGESNSATDNWTQFYGTWTSGPTTTTAVVTIVDLQTASSGNDFGLDDISFATLSTFITLESDPGTDAQTVCKNTPITNIVYNVGNGSSTGPTVTGLPAGVTYGPNPFAGDKITISGTPTVAGKLYLYVSLLPVALQLLSQVPSPFRKIQSNLLPAAQILFVKMLQ